MFKSWRLISFFALCLVIALLINLPVTHIIPWVKLPGTVQINGIDGTLLKGSAQQISLNGFPVQGVKYRYMPSCIPLLKMCYRFSFDQGNFQVAYDFLNGDTEISNTKIDYRVSELLAYTPKLLVKPVGSLELLIENLSFDQGKAAVMQGKLIWRDLGVDDDGIKIDVGDFQLEISGNNPKYDLKLSDLDSSLDVDGSGILNAGGDYRVDINIDSQSGIDPQVKSVLNLVAQNVSYNKYRIRHSGRLPPNLIRRLF